jgi:hypothetical protein
MLMMYVKVDVDFRKDEGMDLKEPVGKIHNAQKDTAARRLIMNPRHCSCISS